MRLSARNQVHGTVTAIKLGGVMAEITVDIGVATRWYPQLRASLLTSLAFMKVQA